MQFEQASDGTVVTSGAFCDYVKYFKVIERILTYVLDSPNSPVPQGDFLEELQGQMTEYLEEKNGKKLSHDDKERISEYFNNLFAAIKAFLFNQLSLQDRGLLYALSQNHAELVQIKSFLERFHMQEQSLAALQEQLQRFTEPRRTEDHLLEKLDAWNSREIKALGEHYNPDVNISLSVTEVFQGATLDDSFKARFLEKTDQFLLSMRHDYSKEICQLCSGVMQAVTELDFLNLKKDVIDHILSLTDDILAALSKKIDAYYKAEDKKALRDDLYQLSQGQIAADEFKSYLASAPVQAAVTPYVVLVGDGGTGKSHLIADFIESRMASGQASLLLLNQSITSSVDVLSSLPGWIGCSGNYI